MQRRGQDWYCHICGPKREPCAACGNTRTVTARDRDGQPRCGECPPGNGQDPIDIVVGLVTAIDPALPPGVVVTAVNAAATQAGQRRRLAWALQDRPELLTGAGAQAPVPSVLRLIAGLCDAGATGIIRPPCPHCGRVIALAKPRDGLRLCRNCVARSRAVPCSRCGVVRETATRDAHGKPLCPYCLITDPANQETCTGCGRRRPVSVRTPDRATMPGMPAGQDVDVLDLRTPRTRRDIQGHRRALVQGMPATMGPVRRLRAHPPGPGRNHQRTAVLDLPSPRSRLLAQLPRVRADRQAPPGPLRPLRGRSAAP